jgi:hypothetical protein
MYSGVIAAHVNSRKAQPDGAGSFVGRLRYFSSFIEA